MTRELSQTSPSIPVAQYLRKSTEHQQYSTANRSISILQYAQEHNMEVVRTYADHGKSGLVLSRRTGLQQLLADAVGAGANFQAVLVYDVSRWGRFQNPDQAASYEYALDFRSIVLETVLHPTLILVFQISELLSLTVEGAHRTFGYNLGSMRKYDMRLNGGRTHVVESYIFERDRIVDVPSELAAAEAFRSDATMGDLIRRWQYDVPVRSLRGRGWSRPGAFYIDVGTKDSAGTSLPAESLALVEPIGREEENRPNPRAIYLLQFGGRYRCSHCLVTRGKLQLISRARTHRNLEFLYGHTVRIVGRIRMFALALPQPEYELDGNLVPYRGTAALLLPWERSSRAQLLATKYKRFRRTHEEEAAVREFLEQQLQTQMSARTERRYRNNDTSEPHVSGLMHLTIAHFARYSDYLRISGATVTDIRSMATDDEAKQSVVIHP